MKDIIFSAGFILSIMGCVGVAMKSELKFYSELVTRIWTNIAMLLVITGGILIIIRGIIGILDSL